MPLFLKLIKQNESNITTIYKIELASKNSNVEGILTYNKEKKICNLIRTNQVFIF